MNLNSIANSAIRAVSPNMLGSVQVSTGHTTNADFSVTPTAQTFPNIWMNVQALSGPELRQLDAVNQQGVVRGVYLNGKIEGLDRPVGKGGDLLLFNNQTWRVTQVMEPWDVDGWCKVAVTLQL